MFSGQTFEAWLRGAQRVNPRILFMSMSDLLRPGWGISADTLQREYPDEFTIGDASAFRILANSPRLYFGAHLSMNEVSHALAKQIVARPVKNDEMLRVELDGEVVGRLPVTFQILLRALRVRC